MIIELSRVQLKHFESALWFINNNPRHGRTYTLAMAYMVSAMARPDTSIYIMDHVGIMPDSNQRKQEVINMISHVLQQDLEVLKHFVFFTNPYRIRYDGPRLNLIEDILNEK